MNDKKRERAAKEAADFLHRIADDAERLKIPSQVIMRLFGMFGRQIVDGLVELGKTREDAVTEVATEFMTGLGINTLFKHIKLNEDGKPPTTH